MVTPPSVEANITALEGGIAAAIDSARSLRDIIHWLQSQPGVLSVDVADYLLKSNPPQREFTVTLGGHGGRAVFRTVTVFDLGEGRFQLNGTRSDGVA